MSKFSTKKSTSRGKAETLKRRVERSVKYARAVSTTTSGRVKGAW